MFIKKVYFNWFAYVETCLHSWYKFYFAETIGWKPWDLEAMSAADRWGAGSEAGKGLRAVKPESLKQEAMEADPGTLERGSYIRGPR